MGGGGGGAIGQGYFFLGANLTGADLAKGQIVYDLVHTHIESNLVQ